MGSSHSRSQDLERVVKISLELTSTISLETLLHRIVHAAVDLTDCESAGILLKEESKDQLRFVAVTSYEDQLLDIPVPLERSIAGASFCSGEPLLVSDVSKDKRYFLNVEQKTGFKARSLLCVPLRYQDKKIGVLEVENKRGPHGFGDRDLQLLTALAAQATIAIENARGLETLHQTYRQMEVHLEERDRLLNAEQEQRKLAEALRQAVISLSSTLDFTEVVDRILDQIGTVIPNDTCNIMLIEEGDFARVIQGRGYDRFGTAETLHTTRLKVADVPGLRRMVESAQPLVIPDAWQDDTWVFSRQEHPWIRSYVGAPILIQGQVIGFLSVLNTQPNSFQPKDGDHLQVFCHHAAIAITNARLYQQAQNEIARRTSIEVELTRHRDHLEELIRDRTNELIQTLATAETINRQLQTEISARRQAEEELRLAAITDSLTGVYNRRQLFILGEQAFNQACRYGKPLTALMIDADHFKTINDTFGHAMGDEMLKLLAHYLQSSVRACDTLGRYGGEEFVILMPETGQETAQNIAQRLLTEIRNLSLVTNLGPVKLTVSIGIAMLQPGSDLSADHLVNRADQALYLAKQAGRDQIAIFTR